MKLIRKLLITKYQNRPFTAVEEDGKIVTFSVSEEEESMLGNIYIARVQNIVKNIQAAFLTFADGKIGYYSLEDNPNPIFTNPKQTDKICIGDCIIVQVEREPMKTKPPTMTSHINLSGKYVVLTAGKTHFGISSKISDLDWRNQCREYFLKYRNSKYGFILRTNAYGVNLEIIEKEMQILIASFQKICDDGIHRVGLSCLYQNPPDFINQVKNIWQDGLKAILTDQKEYYDLLRDYLLREQVEDVEKLFFYQDSWSLSKCYNIERQLERALSERVWLDCGAYLVIQPTEALTVVDINTGKCIGKRKNPDTFLKINLEAAKELAVQLRLRNLSGIILVDFINMEEANNRILLTELEKLIQRDAIKTVLHGMTALGLVELTRKKIRKPLHEQLLTTCTACHGTGRIPRKTDSQIGQNNDDTQQI